MKKFTKIPKSVYNYILLKNHSIILNFFILIDKVVF